MDMRQGEARAARLDAFSCLAQACRVDDIGRQLRMWGKARYQWASMALQDGYIKGDKIPDAVRDRSGGKELILGMKELGLGRVGRQIEFQVAAKGDQGLTTGFVNLSSVNDSADKLGDRRFEARFHRVLNTTLKDYLVY